MNQNIIEISDVLSSHDSGELSEKIDIYHADIQTGRTNGAYISAILAIIIILFIVLTDNANKILDKTQKSINKIKKKYGEWIVEVEKPPKRTIDSEIITMKTIEDLMKISEELGKPVIYYLEGQKHNFYILDESMQYQYILG